MSAKRPEGMALQTTTQEGTDHAMQIHSAKSRHMLAAVLFAGLMTTGTPAAGQSTENSDLPGEVAPVQPSERAPIGDEIIAKLLEQNALFNARLLEYSAVRTYSVMNLSGKVHASETVRMHYSAPGKKTFVTTSTEGSSLIRHLVLNRLIESEISAASGKDHRDSSITPANYTFHLLGQQEVALHHCYVVAALPKRKDKYLFEGKVWIDRRDFAVVRIAGQPAKKLSFWIKRAEFVREYEKIGEFWLPAKDETFVDVRMYGKKILTIEHHIETVNGVKSAALVGENLNAVEVFEKSKSN